MTKSTRIISIDNATIDSQKFTKLHQEALNILREKTGLEEDFNSKVDEIVKETKLPKSIVNKFIKARFKDSTKDVVKAGETFAVLNGALDD